MIFAIGVKLGYKGFHIDIVSAFSHCVPQRQLFVKVPKFLQTTELGGYMLVRRSSFGLPESPRSLHVHTGRELA